MKTLFLLLSFFVFNYCTQAQGCLPGGITFTTQAQIDNFQTNYPGCTEIEGNVTIGDPNGINDITNLNGLNILTSIGGRLSIGIINTLAIQNLTSLSGLENLTSIGGSLVIFSLPLTNLSGLEGLTSIGDSLYIAFNNSLSSLTGLNNLITVGGGVFIGHFGNPWWDNPALTSLTGLESLSSIGNDLFIGYTALSNMAGLNNLTSIGGNLSLVISDQSGSGIPILTSLAGLENLTSCSGINIYGNTALANLTGLENIYPGSITFLSISLNSSLSTCDVQSICDYLASPGAEINIQDNATGCNSQSEVAAACISGFEEAINPGNSINIYPDPNNGKFTISSTSEINSIEIYNMQGVRIYSDLQLNQQSSVEIDVSDCAKGIYFIRFSEGPNNYTSKIINQ
jgi:hypothetical protein